MNKELKYVTPNGMLINVKIAKECQKKSDEPKEIKEWFWCTERPKSKKINIYIVGKNGNPLCVNYYKHSGDMKKLNIDNWTNEANNIFSINGPCDSKGFICTYRKK